MRRPIRLRLVVPPSRCTLSVLFAAGILLGPGLLYAHAPEDRTVARLTAVLEASPADVAVRCRRAELCADLGRWAAAEADWREVLRLDPGRRDARRGCIEVARRTGRREEAARESAAYVARHPDDPEGWRLRGRILREAGDPGAAGSALDRALALDPRPSPEDFRERADAAVDAGRPEAAAAVLALGIVRLGESAPLRWALAELAAKHGRLPIAFAQLERLWPGAAQADQRALRRGDLLAAAGRSLDACAEWTAALERLEAVRTPLDRERAGVRTALRARLASEAGS